VPPESAVATQTSSRSRFDPLQRGTVGPEQTVGSVLACLVGRRRTLRYLDQVGLRSDLRFRAAYRVELRPRSKPVDRTATGPIRRVRRLRSHR
jgi:hypothetical protein